METSLWKRKEEGKLYGEGRGETSPIKAPLAPERNTVKCMKNIVDYSKTSII